MQINTNPQFELVLLKTGITSLRELGNRETFHPVTGPRVEANILHVQQQQLRERAQASHKKFIIWDVGFGAAANALAAIEAFKSLPLDFQNQIEIHSFDKTTAPIEFAIQNSQALEYLEPYLKSLTQLIQLKEVRFDHFLLWNLHLGEFSKVALDKKIPAPDAILFDPYSPLKNPEMWSLSQFTQLYNRLNDQTPCLLSTYSRSTAVRVTLLLAGFYVGRGCSVGEKFETTLASNRLDMLSRPLDSKWLETVRISGNADPLDGINILPKSISAESWNKLLQHKQFLFKNSGHSFHE